MYVPPVLRTRLALPTRTCVVGPPAVGAGRVTLPSISSPMLLVKKKPRRPPPPNCLSRPKMGSYRVYVPNPPNSIRWLRWALKTVASQASTVPSIESTRIPLPPRNGTRAAIRSGTASHTRQATPKIGVGRKKSILAIRLSHGVLKVLEVPTGRSQHGPKDNPKINSDQAQLGSHPSEGLEGKVEVLTGVAGGQLAAHPRLTLRHDGVAEPGHKHPFAKQKLAHLDRLGRFPQDDGHDGGLPLERSEPQCRQLCAEIARVFVQPADQLGVLLDVADRGERAPGDGGRERVAEELGPGALAEVVGEGRGPRGESSRRPAQRLPQG